MMMHGPANVKPIGCPEKSVLNYHYSLRNNPEERCCNYLPTTYRRRR